MGGITSNTNTDTNMTLNLCRLSPATPNSTLDLNDLDLIRAVTAALDESVNVLATNIDDDGSFAVHVAGRPVGAFHHPRVWEHALYLHDHGDRGALLNCL